jgi:hypothetical protein
MKKVIIPLLILGSVYTKSLSQTISQKVTKDGLERTYSNLMYKDMASAMTYFRIKDTIGKTHYAYMPQVEKGTRFVALNVPNGDILLYKDNKLQAILPKQ